MSAYLGTLIVFLPCRGPQASFCCCFGTLSTQSFCSGLLALGPQGFWPGFLFVAAFKTPFCCHFGTESLELLLWAPCSRFSKVFLSLLGLGPCGFCPDLFVLSLWGFCPRLFTLGSQGFCLGSLPLSALRACCALLSPNGSSLLLQELLPVTNRQLFTGCLQWLVG